MVQMKCAAICCTIASSLTSTWAFAPSKLCFVVRQSPKNVSLTKFYARKDEAINIPSPIPSIFPDGLPAGLRGEAVRSSLRDEKKGLWYELTNPSTFQAGLLQVKGQGTLPFLHSKFTESFEKPSLPATLLDLKTKSKGLSRETSFLTGKGRAIDTLSVLLIQDGDEEELQYEALILTSPFHGSGLYNKLSPFVFPLDGITLLDGTTSMAAYSMVSSTLANAKSILKRVIIPELKAKYPSSSISIPEEGESRVWTFNKDQNDYEDSFKIYVMEGGAMLPSVCAKGYTIIIPTFLSSFMKEILIGDLDDNGENVPMEISALELESLRIESGKPGYGFEMTGDISSNNLGIKANPLELHLQSTVDLDKGCYQGQEGVSSIVKNIRGPPRTLYTVIFDDEENSFDEVYNDSDNDGEEEDLEDDTEMIRQPEIGDELYVLGSNEGIQVGVISSVAESGSTGKANTITLALLRRPDSIMKKMQNMELDFGAENVQDDLLIMVDEEEKQKIMEERRNRPPPVDPLEGLEVIIKGTYTVGKVVSIARRVISKGRNMYDDDVLEVPEDNGTVMGYVDAEMDSSGTTIPTQTITTNAETSEEIILPEISEEMDLGEDDEEALAKAIEEANKAAAEAEKAAAEAQRKAEKMEMLRKRAEEAMARRKKKS